MEDMSRAEGSATLAGIKNLTARLCGSSSRSLTPVLVDLVGALASAVLVALLPVPPSSFEIRVARGRGAEPRRMRGGVFRFFVYSACLDAIAAATCAINDKGSEQVRFAQHKAVLRLCETVRKGTSGAAHAPAPSPSHRSRARRGGGAAGDATNAAP